MKTTSTPKERPILFSGPMVRAILDGRKTQTRRIVKPKHEPTGFWGRFPHEGEERLFSRQELAPAGAKPWWEVGGINGAEEYNPYGQPGDRLWVKETHWRYKEIVSDKMLRDGADTWPTVAGEYLDYDDDGQLENLGWKKYPSIFMPRWASRITLEITAVRVERLNSISGYDCIAEGIEPFKRNVAGATITTFRDYLTGETDRAAVQSYRTLWESINGPESWAANPWVWVVEFRKL